MKKIIALFLIFIFSITGVFAYSPTKKEYKILNKIYPKLDLICKKSEKRCERLKMKIDKISYKYIKKEKIYFLLTEISKYIEKILNKEKKINIDLLLSDKKTEVNEVTTKKLECNINEHKESNKCVYNILRCEDNNGIGEKNWLGNTWGECKIYKCKKGYNLHFGVCRIKENKEKICNDDEHKENGKCISNIQSCSIKYGIGEKKWGGRYWNKCNLIRCNEGYIKEGYTCGKTSIEYIKIIGRDKLEDNLNYDFFGRKYIDIEIKNGKYGELKLESFDINATNKNSKYEVGVKDLINVKNFIYPTKFKNKINIDFSSKEVKLKSSTYSKLRISFNGENIIGSHSFIIDNFKFKDTKGNIFKPNIKIKTDIFKTEKMVFELKDFKINNLVGDTIILDSNNYGTKIKLFKFNFNLSHTAAIQEFNIKIKGLKNFKLEGRLEISGSADEKKIKNGNIEFNLRGAGLHKGNNELLFTLEFDKNLYEVDNEYNIEIQFDNINLEPSVLNGDDFTIDLSKNSIKYKIKTIKIK